jgi:hypothetical protein
MKPLPLIHTMGVLNMKNSIRSVALFFTCIMVLGTLASCTGGDHPADT